MNCLQYFDQSKFSELDNTEQNKLCAWFNLHENTNKGQVSVLKNIYANNPLNTKMMKMFKNIISDGWKYRFRARGPRKGLDYDASRELHHEDAERFSLYINPA